MTPQRLGYRRLVPSGEFVAYRYAIVVLRNRPIRSLFFVDLLRLKERNRFDTIMLYDRRVIFWQVVYVMY